MKSPRVGVTGTLWEIHATLCDHDHAGDWAILNGSISISHNAQTGSTTTGGGGFPAGSNGAATINPSQGTSTFSGSSVGSGTAFAILQPTLILNKLLRISKRA
ncbi:hypothetical protein BDS110ZK12_12720 [Bradyrhizobium diazoefficiens]|uniref:Uncharacterized protein n=1 Tax=Bradyrhizobium diazoefficiens TaxID=1355477 RepID=A0A810B2G7_9BRAD|nr:hypothetical protein XF8B_06390 [Bradyrhizobium diazoefficiens]